MGILFHELVFGPLKSRRLGISLGVNLLPQQGKICTYNCVYCECGWGDEEAQERFRFPSLEALRPAIEKRLQELQGTELEPESITFSGNGEPTLHPQFAQVIDMIIELRNLYAPKAKISVLTNGTRISDDDIFNALLKVENNIVKLDGGSQSCIKAINLPFNNFDLDKYLLQLRAFQGQLTIQTLFLRGKHNGVNIDNTTEEELTLWANHIANIKPRNVMIYAIERATPEENLEKITVEELKNIAKRIEVLGIPVEVFG